MAVKNLCAKTVKPDQAHEVWQVEDHSDYGGTWTWYVLKKYQTPEREAQNEYARWLCYVTSPYSPHGDYGDTYITTITEAGAVKLNFNPLVQTSGGQHEASQT
ncbi:MAG: hypothetical protein ACJ797_12520 [Ktedonobacteraceae bacterium]